MARLFACLALAVSACASGGGDTAPLSADGRNASLQSPPFAAPSFAPAPEAEPAAFDAVASQFDPARQHFVWVLPPGLHGKGPWGFMALVKLDGETQFETTLPLVAEMVKSGTRPEYTAGYEIVRLTDTGDWVKNTAEIDGVIKDLIAKHGRGHGALEMSTELKLAIDPAQRQTYCVDNKQADIRVYLEEDGVSALTPLDLGPLAGMFQLAVQKACKD